MIRKLLLIFNTVKHLRFTQIYHQFYYRLKSKKSLNAYIDANQVVFEKLKFEYALPMIKYATPDSNFTFLNLSQHFESEINWNFQDYGKLWNYNLQYFNWLQQADLSYEYRQATLTSIESWLLDGRLPLEPYPVSLRIMNTIRFGSIDGKNLSADSTLRLYGQLNYLDKHLEFHLLGNHLLENAFALLMGGYVFNHHKWKQKARQILYTQMDEQVLADGAHFELSPMYHQIILFRVLELIEWYSSVDGDKAFLNFMSSKAKIMLSWLKTITFKNGDIPHFNDSANNISYSTDILTAYYEVLNLPKVKDSVLRDSGYRKFDFPNYECVIDVGAVGPSYQPGHAHADALSFILYYNNKPLLIEQGTSTYQIGQRRSLERSTRAHNCVVVDEKDQSQVWGGFRVGKRAKVTILKDAQFNVDAEHDGYQALGVIHQRNFSFSENRIEINDQLKGGFNQIGVAYFHFHSDTFVHLKGNYIQIDGCGSMHFEGMNYLKIEDYELADGYNKYEKAQRIIVNFETKLRTVIQLEINQSI